jgi:hypothetical protein
MATLFYFREHSHIQVKKAFGIANDVVQRKFLPLVSREIGNVSMKQKLEKV